MKGAIRLAAWCLAIALVVLPVVGVLSGWFAAGSWPVNQLTVQAEFRHVTANEIRSAVRPLLGRGFFALDLDGVRKAVAALPWVESVEASKRWPNTLLLRVYERQPFARWNDRQLISRQGRIFSVPAAQLDPALPSLSGPDARVADVVSFYAQVLQAFAGTPIHVNSVALTERGSWSLGTQDGALIMLGDSEQAAARLQRFLTVYPQIVAGHATALAYADLRYTNGFAVRWAPADAASPATAGSPRT